MSRSWKRRGDGFTCPPWDIGPYFIDGTTLQVLWRDGVKVGHFEDYEEAMAHAKRTEQQEAQK